MMGVLKVELTKLLKKASTRVFIILYTIILIGMSILYTVAEKIYDLSIYSGTQFVGASLGTMMAFLLPLMAVYLASSSQSIDFSRGTMKNMYLLPISRTKLFMSKIVAVQTILGSVIIVHFVITLIVSFIVDGLTVVSIGASLIDYLGAFLILGLINTIGTIIALLVNNTGLAVILAYVGYIGLGILTIYVPSISGISLTTLINNYANFFSAGAITMLLSTLAYYIILFITGLLIFEKKEESLCQFD
jgi:ABC-2 type transport system permease protein